MGELLGSMSGVLVGFGIGPFAQGGLDEAFGLSVGPWCVGFGADVLDGESFAGIAPGEGPVAGTVVGHDAFDGDAEALVVSDGGLEEGRGADGLFVGLDLGDGDAGMVVDTDVDELPAFVAPGSLAGAITGDAVPDLGEAAEFLDVDVDYLAGLGAFVAALRLGGFEVAPAVEAVSGQDPSHGGLGDADLGGDPVIDAPFLAQGDHLCLDVIGRSLGAGIGPR